MPSLVAPLTRFLLLAAFAAALASCAAGGGEGPLEYDSGQATAAAHDYPVHGIDVSKYQGDVDWNAVAGSGVKFVWIKATEGGDHVDV